MKRQDITDALQTLQLPKGSYIVIGSGVLAALGIRETSDIDLVVSPKVYTQLQNAGWLLQTNSWGKQLLTLDVFEADISWDHPEEQPNLDELLQSAIEIDGVPYVNLERLLSWKQRTRRPKDEADIPLIDAYLA